MAAPWAMGSGETVLRHSASQVAVELTVHEGRQRPMPGLAAFPHPRPMPGHACVEDRPLRGPGMIEGAGDGWRYSFLLRQSVNPGQSRQGGVHPPGGVKSSPSSYRWDGLLKVSKLQSRGSTRAPASFWDRDQFPDSRAWMASAARWPWPMARITVAPPVMTSPPA